MTELPCPLSRWAEPNPGQNQRRASVVFGEEYRGFAGFSIR
jgi:hypothetical protein